MDDECFILQEQVVLLAGCPHIIVARAGLVRARPAAAVPPLNWLLSTILTIKCIKRHAISNAEHQDPVYFYAYIYGWPSSRTFTRTLRVHLRVHFSRTFTAG